MTKTKFFCFAALFYLVCSLFPTSTFAQTSCTLKEKYWAYRKRLNEKFVKVDWESVKDGYDEHDGIGVPRRNPDGSLEMPIRFTKSGTSFPFTYYDGLTNGIVGGGDGTIMLGNYMAMLGTEYRLLKNSGDTTTAEKTLDELFLAIQAYKRLDKEFNYFMLKEGEKQRLDTIKVPIVKTDEFGNPIDTTFASFSESLDCDSLQMKNGVDTSGFSGMFYRSDIYKGDELGSQSYAGQNYNNSFGELKDQYTKDGNKFIPFGTNWLKTERKMGFFTSLDQITGLVYGLSMAKAMIGKITTSDKEREVLHNIDKALAGLICTGINRIRLNGCFEGKGFIMGNGFLGGFEEKLLEIAAANGILEKLDCDIPSKTLNNFLSGNHNEIDDLKRKCHSWPLKRFESNLWSRLYSIVPSDDEVFKSDIKAFSDQTEKLGKYSFGVSTVLFNSKNVSSSKVDYVLESHCDKLKKKLETAPCCGPCVNCAHAPAELFDTDGELKDQDSDLTWFSEDSNADTYPCK
jgi:hypothetical protein